MRIYFMNKYIQLLFSLGIIHITISILKHQFKYTFNKTIISHQLPTIVHILKLPHIQFYSGV